MKRTLAVFIGLALAVSAFTVSAQQAPKGGQAAPAKPPCVVGEGCGQNKDCPYYGTGQCRGQQKRYGQCQGRGQGQGKGFRGGARDGSGPKRDGSCGQCPNKL
jgi:hypothetical protein